MESKGFDLGVFFQFSNSYLFVLNDDQVLSVNHFFCDSFGYQLDEVEGGKIYDIILPKDLEDFKIGLQNQSKVVAQVLTKKFRAIRVEWHFLVKDGFTYVNGIDVTEKLRHQERFEQYSVLLRGVNESLERSSHRLYLLQNALTSTIPYAKNSITNILKITLQTFKFSSGVVVTPNYKNNLAVSSIIGEYEECLGEEIQNKNNFSHQVFNLSNEIIQPIAKENLLGNNSYFEGGIFYLGFPIVYNNKKYGVVEFISKKNFRADFDNNDIQFLRLITEVIGRIIELQRINDELDEKSKKLEVKNNELDEFAHIVSHDLKAPLRAIKNLITFISEDEDNKLSEQSTEDFELIVKRAERMSNLIGGILEYSRAGRDEAPISKFDLGEIVREVTDQLSPMNPNVQFEIGSSFSTVKSKELYMFQIISNLVSNAIKYNDKDEPKVKIDFYQKDKNFLTVEDNGPGIEEKYREKVFGVFETLHGRDEIESTGIGLTIVRKMAKLLGGDVYIEDSNLGGAKFVVEFDKKL